jgi:hypothetical protein
MADDGKTKILTLHEVARRLRCSKAHAAKLVKGQVRGVPALAHVSMGRRVVVREEWLDEWMNECRTQC